MNECSVKKNLKFRNLIHAIQYKNIHLVRLLLPSVSIDNINCLFLYIVQYSNVEILECVNLYYNNSLISITEKFADELIDISIKYNNEKIIDYLLINCKIFDKTNKKITKYAITYNNTKLLEKLISEGYEVYTNILSESILQYHTEIIYYLAKLGYKCTIIDRCNIIKCGMLKILKIIDKFECVLNVQAATQAQVQAQLLKEDTSEYTIDLCVHGNLAMINYLYNRNEKYSDKSMEIACQNIDCNKMHYLYEIGCRFSINALKIMCSVGSLCQLEFALNRNIKFPTDAFDLACKYNHNCFVEHLIMHDNIGSDTAIIFSIENENKELFLLLMNSNIIYNYPSELKEQVKLLWDFD
jgi:hypothetical protein